MDGNVILKTIGRLCHRWISLFPQVELRAPRVTPQPTGRPLPDAATLMNVRSPLPTRPSARGGEFHSLPDKPVTLLDKGFFGADLLLERIQGRRHRPALAHPGTQGLVYTELEPMATVTVCLQMIGLPQARPTLASPCSPGWPRRKRSLPPCPWRDSVAQVATLYHERWEIELGYRDIKSADGTTPSRWGESGLGVVGLLLDTIWSGGRPASRRPISERPRICLSFHREPDGSDGSASPAHTPRRFGLLIGVMFEKNAPGHRETQGGAPVFPTCCHPPGAFGDLGEVGSDPGKLCLQTHTTTILLCRRASY